MKVEVEELRVKSETGTREIELARASQVELLLSPVVSRINENKNGPQSIQPF